MVRLRDATETAGSSGLLEATAIDGANASTDTGDKAIVIHRCHLGIAGLQTRPTCPCTRVKGTIQGRTASSIQDRLPLDSHRLSNHGNQYRHILMAAAAAASAQKCKQAENYRWTGYRLWCTPLSRSTRFQGCLQGKPAHRIESRQYRVSVLWSHVIVTVNPSSNRYRPQDRQYIALIIIISRTGFIERDVAVISGFLVIRVPKI